jgi:hypothetical protein
VWIDDGSLTLLCKQGRIFDIQRWIKEGRPLQLDLSIEPRPHGSQKTALEIAIETGQHSLVELLLEGGYRVDEGRHSPIDVALRCRRPDIVGLLVESGADVGRVDPDFVFDSYDLSLIECFYNLGVDYGERNALGLYLGQRANKPLLGFCRQHKDDPSIHQQLLIGLVEAISDKAGAKRAALCVWAGADPHEVVADERYPEDEWEPAIVSAALYGRWELVKSWSPDPRIVDFDRLYERAPDADIVEYLASIEPPRDLTTILLNGGIQHGVFPAILEAAGRWESADPDSLQEIRRQIMGSTRLSWADKAILGRSEAAAQKDFERLMRPLADPERCDPAIYEELTRTSAMKKQLVAVGLLEKKLTRQEKAAQKQAEKDDEEWRERQRFAKIAERYDRDELYERIWAQPAGKVAEEYGCSGSYIKRACDVLKVPTPPMGYWARVRHGQRPERPQLGSLTDREKAIYDGREGYRRHYRETEHARTS